MSLINYIFNLFGYYKLNKSNQIEQLKEVIKNKDIQLQLIHDDYKKNMELISSQLNNEIDQIKINYQDEIEKIIKRNENNLINRESQLNNEFNLTINERTKLKFDDWKTKEEKIIRKDAISRSKSVTTGQITEHFAPYHPDFKYNSKDARFFESPIDLIIYDGLYDNGNVENIIFMEIKTGKSQMSSKQRSIKRCIESGNIVFEEFRIGD